MFRLWRLQRLQKWHVGVVLLASVGAGLLLSQRFFDSGKAAREATFGDPVEVAARLRIAFDSSSSADDFQSAERWLQKARSDLVLQPVLRELARFAVPGRNLEWTTELDRNSEALVSAASRQPWRLWRLVSQPRYGGGFPGTELQALAMAPANREWVSQLIETLPDGSYSVRRVKQELLTGLMELRLAALRPGRGSRERIVPPVSPRIIEASCKLLEAIPSDEDHEAYFFALSFGTYLQLDFSPDSRAPEYQGKHGLNTEFFAETTRRARKQVRPLRDKAGVGRP